MMNKPILMIELIEIAQKYNSEIHISKDNRGDFVRFYAYIPGRGYTRNFWMSSNKLKKDILESGFNGTIKID